MLALLGCDCPTFDEMEVRAVDESVTAEQVATVEAVLAEFAAWTGEAGVCVPAIELAEDVPEPWWFTSDYYAGGDYRGDFQPIRVDVDDGPRGLANSARHELCHALDTQKGYWMYPDLWPANADRDVVSGKWALREDFALACEWGPVDTSLDRALEEHCDYESHFSKAQWLLDEVVFPGAPKLLTTSEPVPVSVTETEWMPADRGGGVSDISAYDGGVAAIVQMPRDDGDKWSWRLRLYAADLTTRTADVLLRESSGYSSLADVRFLRADSALVVAWPKTTSEEGGIIRIDPSAGSIESLPIAADHFVALAAADSVVYGYDPVGVAAWDDDGRAVTVPRLLSDEGEKRWLEDLWPSGEGLAFVANEGVGTFDGGSWAWQDAPGDLVAGHDLDEARTLFVQAAYHDEWYEGGRTWIRAEGSWRLAGDPCQPLEGSRKVVLGGRIFATEHYPEPGDDDAVTRAWWIDVGE